MWIYSLGIKGEMRKGKGKRGKRRSRRERVGKGKEGEITGEMREGREEGVNSGNNWGRHEGDEEENLEELSRGEMSKGERKKHVSQFWNIHSCVKNPRKINTYPVTPPGGNYLNSLDTHDRFKKNQKYHDLFSQKTNENCLIQYH